MKKWTVLFGSLFMVFLLAACGNKVDEETASKYVEKAEEIVLLLNDEKYDEIYEQFDEKMKAQLTADQLAEIEPVLESSGDYVSIEKQSVEEKDGLHVVVIVGKHSEENRIYTVTYDGDDQIVGLFVQ